MYSEQTSFENMCKILNVSVPKRSTLVSLEPIGVGTPLTECLGSYVSRLANIHTISARELIKFSINNSSNDKVSDLMSFLNGHGRVAEFVTEGIENLTLRRDIGYLSTIYWKGFIQHGSTNKRKRWCPVCFYNWKAQGHILYEPLIWQFKEVSFCYSHHVQLQSECSVCGKTFAACENFGEIGYCVHCSSFLGVQSYLKKQRLDPMEIDYANCIARLIVDCKKMEKLYKSNLSLRTRFKLFNLVSLIKQKDGSLQPASDFFNKVKYWF